MPHASKPSRQRERERARDATTERQHGLSRGTAPARVPGFEASAPRCGLRNRKLRCTSIESITPSRRATASIADALYTCDMEETHAASHRAVINTWAYWEDLGCMHHDNSSTASVASKCDAGAFGPLRPPPSITCQDIGSDPMPHNLVRFPMRIVHWFCSFSASSCICLSQSVVPLFLDCSRTTDRQVLSVHVVHRVQGPGRRRKESLLLAPVLKAGCHLSRELRCR